MKDTTTGIPKVVNQTAGIVSKTPTSPNSDVEYYIYYQWRKRDVRKSGRIKN